MIKSCVAATMSEVNRFCAHFFFGLGESLFKLFIMHKQKTSGSSDSEFVKTFKLKCMNKRLVADLFPLGYTYILRQFYQILS